jgi:hypothetical protein
MRIDGKGNVYIRFSGGKLQFVNELDNTVIASLDTDDNELKPNILRVAEESHLVGRNFFADGELLAGADELNDAGRYGRNQKIFVGSLSSAAAADDIVFSWENSEGEAVVITRVIVDITKAGGTATATIDAGSAADATTGSDNLLTGGDANTTATYDSLDIANEGVATFVKVPDGECVNGQIKTEKAEDLEGKYYIFYAVAE